MRSTNYGNLTRECYFLTEFLAASVVFVVFSCGVPNKNEKNENFKNENFVSMTRKKFEWYF